MCAKKINTRVLLTGISVIGVLGTAVTSYISGTQVERYKRKCKTLWNLKPRFQKVKETAKYYILPVGAAGGTIFAIIKSHRVNSAEIAILGASGAYLAANRKQFETKAREILGDDVLDKIKNEAIFADDHIAPNMLTIEDTGNGDTLCIEGFSGRLFWSDPECVDRAQQEFNELRCPNGDDSEVYSVSYNEYFRLLGLIPTHLGHQVGYPAEDWAPDEISFDNTYIPYKDVEQYELLSDGAISEIVKYYKCDVFISEPKGGENCPWWGWEQY